MEEKEILDTSVAINRKEGIVTIFTVIEYPKAIESFEIIFPETQDYVKGIEIAANLRKKGTPIGAIDTLIAAICLNRKAVLVTSDNDFKQIKEIYSEFKIKN